MFSGIGEALDIVLDCKDSNPKLVKTVSVLLDCLSICGFLLADFNSIRLKEFKQMVNPSYGEVFTQKPEEKTFF